MTSSCWSMSATRAKGRSRATSGTKASRRPEPGMKIRVLIEDVEDAQGLGEETRGMILPQQAQGAQDRGLGKRDEDVSRRTTSSPASSRGRSRAACWSISAASTCFCRPARSISAARPTSAITSAATIQCVVLKIDEARRNIVVSRRALIEQERALKKKELLGDAGSRPASQRRGQEHRRLRRVRRSGRHRRPAAHHRHELGPHRPSREMVAIDQEIEVQILHIDREKEKIALGLKQKSASPWDQVEEKYPVGSTHKGAVVNVMSYGAFVKLEEGIEGLVHISEMSWTKRISHPNELVHIDDEINVVVLGINKEKQEISLGMKQTQENPWDKVADRYPPGTLVEGDASATSPTTARSSRSKKGSTACCTSATCRGRARSAIPAKWSRKARRSSARCSRSISSGGGSRWASSSSRTIPGPPTSPASISPASSSTARSPRSPTSACSSGLENGLEGLLHISELADHKVENPEEVVKVGDKIEVKILRVDTDERKIGLSRKRVEWAEEAEQQEEDSRRR